MIGTEKCLAASATTFVPVIAILWEEKKKERYQKLDSIFFRENNITSCRKFLPFKPPLAKMVWVPMMTLLTLLITAKTAESGIRVV